MMELMIAIGGGILVGILLKEFIMNYGEKKTKCSWCGATGKSMVKYSKFNLCSSKCMGELFKSLSMGEILEHNEKDMENRNVLGTYEK